MRDVLMKKPVSHYESLNVTRDAPTEVIRAAYKSLSQKHHPDKNVGNQAAAEMMMRLNTAYSVLSDPEQRRQYDRHMHEEPHGDIAPSLLHKLLAVAFSRNGRIAAAVAGTISVGVMLMLWSARGEEEKSRMLAQAAVYTPGAEAPPASDWPALSFGKSEPRAKSKAVAVIETNGPSGLRASGSESASPAPSAKPAQAASAAVKPSEFERLTAMLKGMGLGLHKLDAPVAPPPAPAKSAAPARTNDAPAAIAAAAPSAAASSPASRTAAAEDKPTAAEPTRGESKALAEASRASAPAAAITPSPARSSTVVADARDCPTPTYPERSYRNGETGTVLLSLLVGNDGRVIESKVQKSSGFPELDKATRKAVVQCKFKPADGQTEPVWTKMVYAWSLDQ